MVLLIHDSLQGINKSLKQDELQPRFGGHCATRSTDICNDSCLKLLFPAFSQLIKKWRGVCIIT